MSEDKRAKVTAKVQTAVDKLKGPRDRAFVEHGSKGCVVHPETDVERVVDSLLGEES